MDVFATLSEHAAKIDATVLLGTIVESKAKDGKAMVRVSVYERVTAFIPYSGGIANSFVKVWIPPQVGEQVTVVSMHGNPDYGVAFPSIFNTSCKEPEGANANTMIVDAGDTRIESDGSTVKVTAAKVLLDTPMVETTGDLVVAGNITDSRGDLTGHQHSTTDGATAVPR